MKKILFLFLVMACAGMVWAQSSQTDQPQATTSSSTTTTTTVTTASPLSGTIMAVDVKGNSITIMDPATNKATVYTVSKKTTFSRDKKTIKVTELKEGDTVSFVSGDGKTVTSVVISAPEVQNPPQQ
jgi:hypothetical protein